MPLFVRRLKITDLAALEQIELDNLQRYPGRTGWVSTLRRLVERTLNEEPEGMLIADYDGRVAGSAIARNRGLHPLSGQPHGHIVHLSVGPQYRDHHVMERLLREAEAYLRSRGCESVFLTLPVDRTEDADLFRKNGYQVSAWELHRTFK